MSFLTTDEMTTHLHAEVSDAISRGDQSKLEDAIAAAVTEAKGYCSRYRTAQLFDNEDGTQPFVKDRVLHMHVKSIAKWNFIGLANPSIDYDDAELRYNNAVRWLEKVQSGRVVPPGWPPAEEPEGANTFFHVQSNPKRNNHY